MSAGGITDFIVRGGDEAPEPAVDGGNYRDYYDYGYGEGAPPGGAQMLKAFLLAMAVVAIVVVIAVVHLRRKARRFGRALAADLTGARLAQLGWVLYTRPGCPWCDRQMAALGGLYPAHIECTGDAAAVAAEIAKYPGAIACDDPKVVGFPFWFNTKTQDTRAGMQKPADLENMIQAAQAAGGAACPPAVCPPPDCAACATEEVCAACK